MCACDHGLLTPEPSAGLHTCFQSAHEEPLGLLPWFPACAQSGLLVKALGEKKRHDAMMSAEVLSYFRLGRTLDGALVPETPLNAVHSTRFTVKDPTLCKTHFSSVFVGQPTKSLWLLFNSLKRLIKLPKASLRMETSPPVR